MRIRELFVEAEGKGNKVSTTSWATDLFAPEPEPEPEAGAPDAEPGTADADAELGTPAADSDSATKRVLDFIASKESGGDYNKRNGGSRANLTRMSIAQVLESQRRFRTWPGATSSAVGRYQYIRSTLAEMVRVMNLDINTTLFDAATQDAIAVKDMQRRCKLNEWLAGDITDAQFMNLLSRVWAAIPNSSTGQSTYQGVGNNTAGMTAQSGLQQLAAIRTGTATA